MIKENDIEFIFGWFRDNVRGKKSIYKANVFFAWSKMANIKIFFEVIVIFYK